MSRAIFLAGKLINNSNLTVISGTVNAQFPLDNIKHDFSTKVARSTTSSFSILIDILSVSAVDIIAIRGSQIDGIGFTAATIEGSATTVFSGTPINIDISVEHNLAFKELSSSNLRYWKLSFTGTSYVEISNIYIGQKVQMLDNNIGMGFNYSVNTNSKVTKNLFGQRFIDEYGFSKKIIGDIKYANSTEFDQLNDIQLQYGENKPILFILDSNNDITITNSKYLFSGIFYMSDLNWKQVAPGLFDCQISLEESM